MLTPEITSVVDRILTLMSYSKETGVRTSYVQQQILKQFDAPTQEAIIRIVTSLLHGGDPEADRLEVAK